MVCSLHKTGKVILKSKTGEEGILESPDGYYYCTDILIETMFYYKEKPAENPENSGLNANAS